MNKRRGFAHHEFLIVIAIISILAAVLAPFIERIWRISWWFSMPLAFLIVYVLYGLVVGFAYVQDYVDSIREERRSK